jgi:starch synthase (maltosyl-transferring)
MVDGSLRVLHVIDTMGVGGAQRHLVSLVRALRARGHRCLIATSGQPTISGAEGLEILSLSEEAISRRVPFHFTAQLIRLLAESSVDLVHAHLHASSVAAAAATWLYRLPLVVTHHSDREWQRRHDRLLGRWASSRGRPSISVARSLTARLAEAGLQTVTIPNGVAVPAHPPSEAAIMEMRERLHIPLSAFVVGFTGRFTSDKRPLLFVEMAERVLAVHPHARFLMVGDGPLHARAHREIARLGLLDRFTLTGFRGDAEALHAAADVTVLCSRREACPLVPLEAMAAGRPVVGTAVGDVVHQIEHGVTGYVVPEGDAERLAEAVLLLTDPERRSCFGQAARERVAERCSLEGMVDRTLDVYAGVRLRRKSETAFAKRLMYRR